MHIVGLLILSFTFADKGLQEGPFTFLVKFLYIFFSLFFSPLKLIGGSPKYSRAGIYGKCYKSKIKLFWTS